MPSHVFVSHASFDKETAARLVAVLEARGIPCWIAPRNIQPGSDYAASIIDGIENSRAMIFIVSQHLNESHQVTREAERAVHKNIPVIPIRIENIVLNKSLEYFFSTAHWFDAFPPPVDDHLERFAGSLQSFFESADTANQKAALGTPVRPRAFDSPPPPKKRLGLIIAASVLTAAVLFGAAWLIVAKKQHPSAPLASVTTTAPPAVASIPDSTPPPGASTAAPTSNEVTAQPPSPSASETAPPATAPRPGEPYFLAETIGMPMTWVPPLHGWVGTNEVTQDEYAKAGMAVTSHYRGAKRPVDSVSWNDAMKFCELLNRLEREAGRLPEDFAYALPTDEQWKTFVGDAGVEQAVFGRTDAEGTAEVSSKPPNVFGLYDVMGNLWEWTADWHPAHVGKERALRGGGYASRSKEIAMADARYSGSPTNRYRLYGFRVVLVKTPTKPAAAD